MSTAVKEELQPSYIQYYWATPTQESPRYRKQVEILFPDHVLLLSEATDPLCLEKAGITGIHAAGLMVFLEGYMPVAVREGKYRLNKT